MINKKNENKVSEMFVLLKQYFEELLIFFIAYYLKGKHFNCTKNSFIWILPDASGYSENHLYSTFYN